jgi:hypothetical protein
MFLKKIKNWLKSNDDITVDVARDNYKKYEDGLEKMRKTYIKGLCDQIKTEARKGHKSITTLDTCYDFVTYEYLEDLKEYFEQRGFKVKEESNHTGILKSWLRISWE